MNTTTACLPLLLAATTALAATGAAADTGLYAAEPTGRAAASAPPQSRMAVPAAQDTSADATLRPGTRVRNRLTREWGTLSGRVTVLADDAATLDRASAELGLEAVSRSADGRLRVLQAGADTDLRALQAQLLQRRGVREVRLDVQEKRFKPQ